MEYDPNRKISNRYLRLALRKIKSENYSEKIVQRHVAVIVKSGRILAVGRNRDKTHPVAVAFGDDGARILKSIHAELDAISRVKNKEQLRGATIYVARVGRSGHPGMSCPCSNTINFNCEPNSGCIILSPGVVNNKFCKFAFDCSNTVFVL